MNIILDLNTKDTLSNIFEQNIKFLDTKCNNMMDGEFTKIIYSDECVSLNGLYLICALHTANNGKYGFNSNILKMGEDLDKNRYIQPQYTILQRPKSSNNLTLPTNNLTLPTNNLTLPTNNLTLPNESDKCVTPLPICSFSINTDFYVQQSGNEFKDNVNTVPYRMTNPQRCNNLRPSNILPSNDDLIEPNIDENRKWINSYDKFKNILSFQPNYALNIPIIQQFVQFEKKLLEYYKQYTFCKKKMVYLLQNQLLSGSTKVYRDLNENTINNSSTTNVYYIIKISGVWESVDTIGITYKFLEMY